jgi:hypothetical protein
MITLHHRTAEAAARQIVTDGFRDGEGLLQNGCILAFWFPTGRSDENKGACGNAQIRIELAKDEGEIAAFQWIEDDKSFREWLVPANLINEFGSVEIQEIDAEPLWTEGPR